MAYLLRAQLLARAGLTFLNIILYYKQVIAMVPRKMKDAFQLCFQSFQIALVASRLPILTEFGMVKYCNLILTICD
jgi:hypothetical protein